MSSTPPDDLHNLFSSAVSLHQSGRLADAQTAFHAILAEHPHHNSSNYHLGLIALQSGRAIDALHLIGRAVAAEPRNAEYLNSLGFVLHHLGRYDEAIAAYQCALSVHPGSFESLNNLANSLMSKGDFAEAESAYRRSIALRPDFAPAHLNLGLLLISLGRAAWAVPICRRALELGMNEAQVHLILGNALFDVADYAEAEQSFRRAIALHPDSSEAWNNLGSSLWLQARSTEAIAAYKKSLEIDPKYLAGRQNLLRALRDLGEVGESIGGYLRALAVYPEARDFHSEYLHAMHFTENPDPSSVFHEHVRWCDRFAKSLEDSHPAPPCAEIRDRPIRVGFLSTDFCEHPVASFMEGLFASHDRRAMEIICYADLRTPDAMTARLQKYVDGWKMISGHSDESVAEMVRSDRIDVLIDLSGHTPGNRLLAFARRPAPVQMTWCGYPDTTGLNSINYRLTDNVADPPGSEHLHSEKLLRLPGCFLCFTPPPDAPGVAESPSAHAGHVTFGCFNILPKINPMVIACWSRILAAVPNSRLILKNQGLTDAVARARIHDSFAAHGIDSGRIDLLGRRRMRNEHLAAYHHMDIALDTFPYNGTTTTCEALWMGVPVVTLSGNMHMSRVGASLLAAAGLAEWSTADIDSYVHLTIRRTQDISALSVSRRQMRQRIRASPLIDSAGFAIRFTKLLREVLSASNS